MSERKKAYMEPVMDVEFFKGVDVIVTSGDGYKDRDEVYDDIVLGMTS